MPTAEIEELKNCFVRQLSPLRVYLFGSFAEGRQNDDSDYDFYIVVNDDTKDIISTTAQAYKSVRRAKTRPVDIVVGTSSRFESRKGIPSLESEVYRNGVLLYAQ